MPAPLTITDPVGAEEIAERLGVSRATVHTWRTRSKTGQKATTLPEPEAFITKTPVWSWETIRAWAETTGRLP